MKSLKAIVEKTADGYSAYIELEGGIATTTGASLVELKKNIREAYMLVAEDLALDPSITIELSIDIAQVFEYFPTINQSAFANYIGMNRSLLSQYVNGIKEVNESTTTQIMEGIKKLGEEYASLS